MNTELPPLHEAGKLTRLDLRIKLTDGKHLNVEIQLKNEHNIEKRSLFYGAKLFTEQMTAGMHFEELCPAIAINILDFNYLAGSEYHNSYRMKNTKTHDELTDIFEIDFIELPKVPEGQGKDLKDYWAQFIAADSEEVLEMLTTQSPVFEKAVSKLVYISADEQLRYELDMREKAELDYYSGMKSSYIKGQKEGKAEGIAEGEAKGEAKGKAEIVRNLLALGVSVEDIQKASGLTLDEIEQLRSAD
jgi:predicted transposase/invertase (TIGR01784 family)